MYITWLTLAGWHNTHSYKSLVQPFAGWVFYSLFRLSALGCILCKIEFWTPINIYFQIIDNRKRRSQKQGELAMVYTPHLQSLSSQYGKTGEYLVVFLSTCEWKSIEWLGNPSEWVPDQLFIPACQLWRSAVPLWTLLHHHKLLSSPTKFLGGN